MNIVIQSLKPALCHDEHEFNVLVRIQSDHHQSVARKPLNLAVVIDRSGSMSGAKLAEAKKCVTDLVARLVPTDRISIVQYNSEVRTLIPLSPVAEAGISLASTLARISADGETDLHGGWLRGSEMVAPFASSNDLCHVILLSDGRANCGTVLRPLICDHVEALAGAGVSTTTIGIGTDFNESLMTSMAHSGQGRAYYGERAVDLAETFDAEVSLLTRLLWRSVRLSIEEAPKSLRLLNEYPTINGSWAMPSIADGSECWALVRMKMSDAIRAQHSNGTALSLCIEAVSVDGSPLSLRAQLDPLPTVSARDYANLNEVDLVRRRINEIRAADIQLLIRGAAERGDWSFVRRTLKELEEIGDREPWVAASISFIREMMEQEDEARMSKEMTYKSLQMRQRLTSIDEVRFSAAAQASEVAFLRRKVAEGRRTE